MSYESTKPIGTPTIATAQGWVDAHTGELLVAIKDLESKLRYGSIDTSGEVVEDMFAQAKPQRLVEPAPVSESISATAEMLTEPAPQVAMVEGEVLSEPAPDLLTEKKTKKAK